MSFNDPECGHRDTARPFVMGAAVGVRCWNVDPSGVLRGVTYPQAWRHRDNEALCLTARSNPDVPEDPNANSSLGCLDRGYNFEDPDGPPRLRTGFTSEACDGLDPNCACGFYAYHDMAFAPLSGYFGNPRTFEVKGMIAGAGRVILGPKGFRVQRANIVALVKPDLTAGLAAQTATRHITELRLGRASQALVQLQEARGKVPFWAVSRRREVDYTIALVQAEIRQLEAREFPALGDVWGKVLDRYPVTVYDDLETLLEERPTTDLRPLLGNLGTEDGAAS